MILVAKHPIVPAYESAETEVLVTAGTDTPMTVDDAEIVRSTGSTVRKDAVITHDTFAQPVYTTRTPEIATVNSNGYVTRTGNGTAEIVARTGPNRQIVRVPVSQAEGATIDTLTEWVAGSLAKHASDNVDTRISGKTPSGTTLNVFSARDDAAGTYERNEDLWVGEDYALAMTGLGVWQSDYGSGLTRAQTLITPRHIVGAAHYHNPITIGGIQRFVTAAGAVVERTVIATRAIPSTDIQLSLLSSDLPATIQPVSILPESLLGDIVSEKLPNLRFGIPCAVRNQYGELRIVDWNASAGNLERCAHLQQMPASRQPWYRIPVVGDSGGGVFALIEGQLVLVWTWTTAGYGPAYRSLEWSAEIPALDAAAGVSTGYLPEAVGLEGYNTY